MEVIVWCPNCNKIWSLVLEEHDDDRYEEGTALICPECTKTDSLHQNGSVIVEDSTSLDVFPGDC